LQKIGLASVEKLYSDASTDFEDQCTSYGLAFNKHPKILNRLALIKEVKELGLQYPFIYDPLDIGMQFLSHIEGAKNFELEGMASTEFGEADLDGGEISEVKI